MNVQVESIDRCINEIESNVKLFSGVDLFDRGRGIKRAKGRKTSVKAKKKKKRESNCIAKEHWSVVQSNGNEKWKKIRERNVVNSP